MGRVLDKRTQKFLVKDKKLIEREKMEKNGYLSNTKRWFYAEKSLGVGYPVLQNKDDKESVVTWGGK